MGTSEKIMHYANFNITYGPTEDPMLTHFEDIIWPAFLSDFKRGKKNEHPLFYLSDIALKEISGDKNNCSKWRTGFYAFKRPDSALFSLYHISKKP